MFDRESFLENLPHLPGVYRMLNAEQQVIYVGKALDLKKRVASYFRGSNTLSPRIQMMVAQIESIEITVTRSESEALLLENNLIKSLTPRYNILFRDDKSYPYVVLSGHRYPRLGFFRGTPSNAGEFFGPYPSAGAVRESISLLQKVFHLRTCEDSVFSNRSRPCLLHQIGRCTAPCVDAISSQKYAEHVNSAKLFLRGNNVELLPKLKSNMESAAQLQHYEEAALYRDQIQALSKVQESQFVSDHKIADSDIVVAVSRSGIVCVSLTMIRNGMHLGEKNFFPRNAQEHDETTIIEAFLRQHYLSRPVPEQIIVNVSLADQNLEPLLEEHGGHNVKIITKPTVNHRVWVEMATKNAEVALAQNLLEGSNQQQMLGALHQALALDDSVQRIECFDASHTMGEATVVSCVVYDKLNLQKGEYRRYNITNITPGDDYAALENAITRRYEKATMGEGKIPDLILIDGGKGQVSTVSNALSELGLNDIPLVGIAKGIERKPGKETLVFADKRPPLQFATDDIALHLIQKIRDEAHRFAITGHRARRAKTRMVSSLEKIDGIGVKRRQRLLTQFGGLKGLRAASIDDLSRVQGISKRLAEKIYSELH